MITINSFPSHGEHSTSLDLSHLSKDRNFFSRSRDSSEMIEEIRGPKFAIYINPEGFIKLDGIMLQFSEKL